MKSLFTSYKKISPNNVFKEKPIALPCKLQNSSLWISGMRDPYIDVCRGVSQLLGF